jgi:hypothetical protein
MAFFSCRLEIFVVLAIWILLDVTHGLSGGPSLPHPKAVTTNRREVLSTISSVAASAGFFSAGLAPVKPPPALAAEDFSFVSYQVMPDASEALDPRLVRLDVRGT